MAADLIVRLEAYTPDVLAQILTPTLTARAVRRYLLDVTARDNEVDVDVVEAT